MAVTRIAAEARKDFGKGFARRARQAGKVPAVIYSSHLDAPVHVTLDAHEMFMILKGSDNAVISVELDGDKQLALVKDVQRHPVTRVLQHVDLLGINRSEKVDVDVAIVTTGEPAQGTMVSVESMTLAVSAPVMEIPESIEISVEGLEDGSVIRLEDITLPADVETSIDPETVLLTVSIPQLELPEEGEEAEGEEAEGEEAAEAEEAEAGEEA
ncbi:50S ribosomal protein L25/general stress protein Ctc [Boudabousia liubingyangii]|uniref:Large ribosomal subunit protein bL25 n=1 Tax=Boudabousia liubingyangii TaxID=1921764 RepID=A0A1Q5PJP1_9ACTO|nr:50S ribosomal protein L25/general stress protein Ctc [Boudabousia liubingyangii]OKL46162.1 50S ribosomal protein L25/general stress protein Ctc [Boudabousia liubingyangii]OKL46311.1 50S ribosomal protein L25/general stress protein Ctc [Boudabousia liubingyangii]